jgi:phage shock protein PspC (stress-responsive transcriptional regulator)
MAIKFDLDPTIPRVVIIALLLFLEGFCIPAYTITVQGRFPEPVEWLTFFFASVIQVATYLLTFLGFKQSETKE